MIDAGLQATLALIVPELQLTCDDPWCLIGSAAAQLMGADVAPADVDVLVSRADADRLIARWMLQLDHAYEPTGVERFRSRFARFHFPGLPVEVMGGLELNGDEGWQPVRISQMVLVGVNGLAVPVPSISEQIRVLESFGRTKDRQRADLLRGVCLLSPLGRGLR
ncbi:hypothetical protein [Rhodanobacter sp. MP7CTX1]|uniref:hypothetical protein n=1 Tax=Rhodanobacter sp. MP7CTX1 TaxID=2723084 RepID=UPI00185BBA40|nr:hypothetical protein [Rhodanobacter sp. MP7CTX1]MBB6189468.1 hypothetical protein [Rhodanobacter sp. MP7CTX1]